MQTKRWSVDLPVPRAVRGVEVVQEAFRFSTGTFFVAWAWAGSSLAHPKCLLPLQEAQVHSHPGK